jgi:ADP-ribosyl-[dinitrogen reductase] hydrolase
MTPDLGSRSDRVLGLLLGGACGDALGAQVEFQTVESIRARFGAAGVIGFEDVPAPVTDDTQMSLFTLEGLIRGHRRLTAGPAGTVVEFDVVRCVHSAYLRWLHIQEESSFRHHQVPAEVLTGWLIGVSDLFACRSPGTTCLTALRTTSAAGQLLSSFQRHLNTSKGSGAVMRAAPVGMWPGSPETVFRLASATGALTHSHPTGYLAAGMLAVIVRGLLHGTSLVDAIDLARSCLRQWPEHDEVDTALDRALSLARRPERLTPEEVESQLGGGWIAEEALAISIYAALVAPDFADGIRLAVNHSGDSDTTGAIAGNLLGARFGVSALPVEWRTRVELAELIEVLAGDAVRQFTAAPSDSAWSQRYPAS